VSIYFVLLAYLLQKYLKDTSNLICITVSDTFKGQPWELFNSIISFQREKSNPSVSYPKYLIPINRNNKKYSAFFMALNLNIYTKKEQRTIYY
jgi:hypothetical protein